MRELALPIGEGREVVGTTMKSEPAETSSDRGRIAALLRSAPDTLSEQEGSRSPAEMHARLVEGAVPPRELVPDLTLEGNG